MADDSDAALVLRPKHASSTGALLPASFWVVASAAFLLRFKGVTLAVLAIVDALVIVFAVAWFRRSAGRAEITLVDDRLVHSGAFHDRELFTEGRPGRVAEIELDWGILTGRKSRLWLLTNSNGRVELSLNRSAWNPDDLKHLRDRLHVPLEVVDHPLRLTKAHKEFPGAIPWWAVHPLLTTYAFLALIVIAVLLARA